MKAPEPSLAPIWGAKSGNYKATMRGDNALPHLWRTAAKAARQTLRTKKFIPPPSGARGRIPKTR
jgi:hypothetical protein